MRLETRRALGVLLVAAMAAAGCTPGAQETAEPAGNGVSPLPQTSTAAPTAATEPLATAAATAETTATLPAVGLPEMVTPGTPEVSGGEAQGEAAPGDLVAMAVADLAQRTGAATAEVQVVMAEAVVWPDGSLGCPERGMTYTMAEVNGYRIVLSWQGQEHDYRGSENFVRLCESR
jgi:hypothetical protein